MEWLNEYVLNWHWVVFGMLLIFAEIFAPAFFLLWFGVSAIIVGLIGYVVDISFTLELFLWGGLSVICLIAWFKWVSPRMQDRTFSGLSREHLLSQTGTVIEFNVQSLRGKLRFPAPISGSDEWMCIGEEGIKPGDRVRVMDISGNHLIIKKLG